MADVAGVIVRAGGLPPRTLLYVPPTTSGGLAATVIPADTEERIARTMIAVAVGLHLDGTLAPAIYMEGNLTEDAQPRHHAAHAFARAFMADATPRGTRSAQEVGRAG